MNLDLITGSLIALAAVCVGGLFTILVLYWLDVRDERRPPGRGSEPPEPGPQPDPLWEVPDFLPDEWTREAA